MKTKKTNKLNRNTFSKQERPFNMKKLFLFVASLSVCALAAEGSLEDRVDGIQAQVDRVLSKAGIHFGGEFRSQFLNSSVDSDAESGFGKKTESSEYTSVDFDIVARPNTAFSARALFRLHQDWRNFFSDVQNPITSRWLSIDGSLGQGIFAYNLGDYRKKLTPLTLWSPDLELLYEPEIFAQGRELAMSEVFLGGNNRALQGANIEFKAELYPILNELNVDVFAARLATRGTGESAVIPPGVGEEPNGNYWDADFDKYLVGVNFATQFIKGAGLGISNISMFDNVDSYRGDSAAAKLNSVSNNVFAARVNADNRAFMADDFVRFGISAELALSSYKYLDTLTISGTAINAGLFANFNFDETNSLRLSADYVMNDSAFINEAAQSPSFWQHGIMNNEYHSGNLDRLGYKNPFDAIYRSVFKYTPSQHFAESRPYSKSAYTNGIYNKDDLAKLPTNVFQDALPGGLATADRVGPVVKLDGTLLDEALTVGARVAMLNGVGKKTLREPYTRFGGTDNNIIINDTIRADLPIAEYLTAGGGVSVDIAKFAPALGPSLRIGGSFMMYNSTTGDAVIDDFQGDIQAIRTASVFNITSESQLLSAEVVYNFVSRFSFLFGYQQLATTIKSDAKAAGAPVPDQEYKFSNLGVGFGYKVTEGGALTVKLTMLTGEGPVGELDAATGVRKALSYTTMQPEVYLTVKF